MINCEQAQHLFESYLNDELSSSLTAELDAHRLKCQGCQQQLTLLEACGNVVRLDTSEPRLSDDFGDRLMAILEDNRSPRHWLQINRTMKLAGGLVGLAAALLLLAVFFPQPTAEPLEERVAGAQAGPPNTVSAADWIVDLPFDSVLGATDLLDSTLELGQYGFNHLQDKFGVPPSSVPLHHGLELNALPDQEPLDPDVFDTLPDLDDGGELM